MVTLSDAGAITPPGPTDKQAIFKQVAHGMALRQCERIEILHISDHI